MADGAALPEDDQEFLKVKGIEFEILRESISDNEERVAIEFKNFQLPENLFKRTSEGQLVPAVSGNVLVIVPKGYSKVRLDSWYISPAVFCQNGQPANCAGSEVDLFGRKWQFWSRHLTDEEWRDGVDGLETYIQYINAGLRNP